MSFWEKAHVFSKTSAIHIAVRGVAIDYPLGLPLDFFFVSVFRPSENTTLT